MKYERLEVELRQMARSEGLRPHDRFPSENEIRERFGVSRDTAQKALFELEKEGLVYRKPRSGTFVSPRKKSGKILFLYEGAKTTFDREVLLYNIDPLSFYLGLNEENQRRGAGFEILFQTQDDWTVEGLRDRAVVWQDLRAVIVFRSMVLYDVATRALEGTQVLVSFYGSDTFRDRLPPSPHGLYSEERLVALALDHLHARGHRKIACLVQRWPVGLRREEEYRAWMKAKGLPVDPAWAITRDESSRGERLLDWHRRLAAHGLAPTALFSTVDHAVLPELQSLREAGIRMPEDLAIAGIDRLPQNDLIRPRLTSVEIPLVDDARALLALLGAPPTDEPPPFHYGTPRLVLGETT